MAARKLRRKQGREAAGAFLVEGPTAVVDAVEAGVDILDVFLDEDIVGGALPDMLAARNIPVWTTGRDVISSLSETVSPQGVVAVVADPTAEVGVVAGADLVLVLADVRDPGNAGTLIRSAVAAGADAVVFAKGSVDPLHPKVVRAAAGAIFQIPLVSGVGLDEVIEFSRSHGLSLVGTAADAQVEIYEAQLSSPTAIVLGNEAWGLPEGVEAMMDVLVSIPMPGPAESLNVSVAGSVLLFETLRQRRSTATGPSQSTGLSSGLDD